jgi:hypothetical protein
MRRWISSYHDTYLSNWLATGIDVLFTIERNIIDIWREISFLLVLCNQNKKCAYYRYFFRLNKIYSLTLLCVCVCVCACVTMMNASYLRMLFLEKMICVNVFQTVDDLVKSPVELNPSMKLIERKTIDKNRWLTMRDTVGRKRNESTRFHREHTPWFLWKVMIQSCLF